MEQDQTIDTVRKQDTLPLFFPLFCQILRTKKTVNQTQDQAISDCLVGGIGLVWDWIGLPQVLVANGGVFRLTGILHLLKNMSCFFPCWF